jgi:hypothetical protein
MTTGIEEDDEVGRMIAGRCAVGAERLCVRASLGHVVNLKV